MLRRIAQLLVLLLIAGLALWAWRPTGETRTIRVYGASMAPALLGEHDAWVCVDCRFPFATGADYAQDNEPAAICPNCGMRQPDETSPKRLPGDRLIIDLLDTRAGKPMILERWGAIVFRTPLIAQVNHAQSHSIKRVVGLPGETVELRGGDVWINGELARKTLAQQQALAIVVHDSRFQPKAGGRAQAWRGAESGSGWIAARDGSFFNSGTSPRQRLGSSPGHPRTSPGHPGASTGELPAIDWLEYTHWRRSPQDAARFEPADIMDDCAYNRGESRRLNRVDDLLLTARVQARGTGELCFRGSVAGHTYVVQLEPERGRGRLLRDGATVTDTEFDLHAPLLATPAQVDFSLIDHQILLAIDGQVLVQHVCDEAEPARSKPLALGTIGLQVEVSALTLRRDIYYIEPPRPGAVTRGAVPLGGVTLGHDEYYVLGDNSPVSADSRTGWPQPGLAKGYLVGTLRAPSQNHRNPPP